MRVQNQIYGVTLPVHIAQRARIVAAMSGKSRSSLMRDLLLDYLKGCDELPAPLQSFPARVDSSPIMPTHNKRKSNKRKETLSPLTA